MTGAVVSTTKGFDVLLVVHALLAVSAFVVLLVLRAAAAAVARGGEVPTAARRSFTGRREVAGRVLYLVPASGLGLLALSRGAYDLASWFVGLGLAAWALATVALETVAFPAQRRVAAALRAETDAVGDARSMVRAVEVAALCVVVAAVVMVAAPV